MIIYAFISVALASFLLVASVSIIKMAHKTLPQKLVFLLTSVSFIWNIASVLMFIAATKEGVWFWFRFGSFFGIMIFPLILHFSVSLNSPKNKLICIAYLCAFAVQIRNLVSTYVFSDIVRVGNFWTFSLASGSFWLYYWVLYELTMIILTVTILVSHLRHSLTKTEKRQTTTLVIIILSTFFIGMVEAYIIAPLLNIPSFSPLFDTFLVLGIWYVLYTYQASELTDNPKYQKIIDAINACVIILNTEKLIITQNSFANEMFGFSIKESYGKPLYSVLTKNQDWQKGFERLKHCHSNSFTFKADLHSLLPKEHVSLSVAVSTIKNQLLDTIGFMVICHKLDTVQKFIQQYNISKREWEIIQKLVTGATNKEIAKSLCISERTVKCHASSIYSKLNVENKVQMIQILKEYGLY